MKKVVLIIIVSALASINLIAQSDSLRLRNTQHDLDSISELANLQFVKDSLAIDSWAGTMRGRVSEKFNRDSLSLLHQMDSVQKLGLPTDRYKNKLDSISHKKTELLNEVNGKQEKLLSKSQNQLQDWQSKVKSKLGLDSLQHHTGLNIPGANLPINGQALSDKGLPGGYDVPEIPALSQADINVTELSPDLNVVNESLSVPQLDGLKNINEQRGGVTQKVDQVAATTKSPDKAVEAAAGEVKEVNAVKEQIEGADAIKGNEFVERAKQLEDPEAIKQAVQQEATKEAVNHFAGKQEVLQKAMEQVAKYKKKYSSLNSLSEATRKRANEMKDKPLIERLLPGIAFQIHKQKNLMIDFNPYVGYKFTGKLTAGLGWNQRVAFVKWNSYDEDAKIYGPRAYAEYKVWKGFSPRVEFEMMNTYIPPFLNLAKADSPSREWVPAVMVGLKKDYGFIKNVRGTASVMFNLYNPHHKSPYLDVVNTRFGFEFPFKKKVKKTKD